MPRPKNACRKAQSKLAAAAKKRKCDENHVTADNCQTTQSDTAKKIAMLGAADRIKDVEEQTWILLHLKQINILLHELLCPICIKPRVTISLAADEHAGFSSMMKLTCGECGYEIKTMSSPRMSYTDKNNLPYEINRRMDLFSHECGGGLNILNTFSVVMGIPGMALSTFQEHDKIVTDAEIETGNVMLQRTADVVRKAYAENDEDLKSAIDAGENPIINISVSYDGTWQKRGFTSLYGVGACIDILTGLVVDYHVLSKYCHACKLADNQNKSNEEMITWKKEHAPDCCKNHEASSKSMEAAAAVILWSRSVDKFGFRYLEMLSDGDSSAFKAVCDAKPYADFTVEKLDCVNHAHKRMGTALRKLAKNERLGGRGVGRLTDAKCDSLQNFYRGAVLSNIPDITKMKNAIWGSLWHSMSTDKEPRHQQCPTGPNSWCFYQKAIANGVSAPSHAEHRQSTFLSQTVAHSVIPVYRRMSEDNLLKRLIHGGTQNRNESLNNMIWLRCPKTSFMGLSRVRAAVGRAVSSFNEGSCELFSVLETLHLKPSAVAFRMLTDKDEARIKKANASSEIASKLKRKYSAIQRRQNQRNEDTIDGNTYESGAH